MRLFVCTVTLLGLFLLPPSALADTAEVWDMLAGQQQASGQFAQELYDETGELLERSSGRYAVLRPEFFRWDIEFPDRQQILLAKGELWHYDIDLASATRRDAMQGGDFTPLELLGGDRATLEPRFAVERLAEDSYRMIPRFAGAGFAAVDLNWQNGEIVAMEIRDRSGQLIRLAMTPDEQSLELSAEDFTLDLPEGVEVYDPQVQ